jgi:hypothetical protein
MFSSAHAAGVLLSELKTCSAAAVIAAETAFRAVCNVIAVLDARVPVSCVGSLTLCPESAVSAALTAAMASMTSAMRYDRSADDRACAATHRSANLRRQFGVKEQACRHEGSHLCEAPYTDFSP